MGWSTFSERCMKCCMGFKVRIERMHENRWVRKVCEHVGEKSKWLKTCKRVVKKYGLKCSSTNQARMLSVSCVWQCTGLPIAIVFAMAFRKIFTVLFYSLSYLLSLPPSRFQSIATLASMLVKIFPCFQS